MDICKVCKDHNIGIPEPILYDNDEDPILYPWHFCAWAALQTPGVVYRKPARYGPNVLSEITWNCIKERYVTYRQGIAILCLILDGATAENFAGVGWKPKDEEYHGGAIPNTQEDPYSADQSVRMDSQTTVNRTTQFRAKTRYTKIYELPFESGQGQVGFTHASHEAECWGTSPEQRDTIPAEQLVCHMANKKNEPSWRTNPEGVPNKQQVRAKAHRPHKHGSWSGTCSPQ